MSEGPGGEISVGLGARSYPVVVASSVLDRVMQRVDELAPTKVVLITDRNVANFILGSFFHGGSEETIASRLGKRLGMLSVLKPGEATKTLATVERLFQDFLEAGLDRKGLVIGLGGGVVGDISGFAAATWMRGVRVIHVPTTLLAMVDSAIGGKTGVNFARAETEEHPTSVEVKNLVGAFHQPKGVFAGLDVLATLPEREVRCGLGEVLKTAVLAGEELLSSLEQNADKVRALDRETIAGVILACARHKAGVVERDEREDGERALLNLGHTLGHALEGVALAQGPPRAVARSKAAEEKAQGLAHGEAVAIGLRFALALSVRLGLCEASFAERVNAIARALGLELSPGKLDTTEVLELMRRDKKAAAGKIRFVLVRGPGQAELVSGVDEKLVLEELAKLS